MEFEDSVVISAWFLYVFLRVSHFLKTVPVS